MRVGSWVENYIVRVKMRANFVRLMAAVAVCGLVSVPGWAQTVAGEQVVGQRVMNGPGPAPASATALFHATGPLPSYDVATIKTQTPGPMIFGGGSRNLTRFIGTGRMLIGQAYNAPLGSDRVMGGPSWLDSDRYSIEGKIPDDIVEAEQKMTPEERQAENRKMQQSLLTDRFKLKVHFETRELPVYELVVVKGGSKLTPAKDPESVPPTAAASGPPLPPGLPKGPPDPSKMRQGIMALMKGSGMEMTVRDMTLQQVFQGPFLGLNGRPVIDKTGLTGKYDFTLDFARENMGVGSGPMTELPGGANAPAPDDSMPSVFTAVQEQLGLRLVPSKAQIEVLVIDGIEKPSEN